MNHFLTRLGLLQVELEELYEADVSDLADLDYLSKSKLG